MGGCCCKDCAIFRRTKPKTAEERRQRELEWIRRDVATGLSRLAGLGHEELVVQSVPDNVTPFLRCPTCTRAACKLLRSPGCFMLFRALFLAREETYVPRRTKSKSTLSTPPAPLPPAPQKDRPSAARKAAVLPAKTAVPSSPPTEARELQRSGLGASSG